MESKWTKRNDVRKTYRKRLFDEISDVTKHITAQGEEVYQNGTLDAKTKRLVSLGIALGIGCENCILSQTEHSLNLGATKEEILEIISVVMCMRGTTGVAEGLKVLEFLDELK